MVRTVEEINDLYKILLGRELNTQERPAAKARIEAAKDSLDGQTLVAQIIGSAEFFARHREKLWPRIFPHPCPVTAQTPLGQEVFADLRQLHGGFAIATGHYEPAETAFVTRTVRRGMTVLDIGANVGYFTTMMGALVGAGGHVHAFEPLPDTYRKLLGAIQRNGFGHIVTTYNFALGDQAGEIDIVVGCDSLNVGGAHIGASDIEEKGVIRHRTSIQRLDDFLPDTRVDFIKIDVEGAEPLVFSGGENLLKRSRPIVMLEINEVQLRTVSKMTPGDLIGRLLAMDYGLHSIRSDGTLRALDAPERQAKELLARSGVINLVAQEKN